MEPTCEDGFDAWRSHLRVCRHFSKFRDQTDRAGVLSGYARLAESGEWDCDNLQRHAFHVAAWVALLPLSEVMETSVGPEGLSPALLLVRLLGLLRDVKPSAWLFGMLLVVAARLGEVAGADSDMDSGPWASLRRVLQARPLDDQSSRSTSRGVGSKALDPGARHRPTNQACELALDQVWRPPRWWTKVGPSMAQSTDAEKGSSAAERVERANMSADAQACGTGAGAIPSLGTYSRGCSQKALHLFQRACTSWQNQTSWQEQQAPFQGLTLQFAEACKHESQMALCKVLRKLAAALSAPRCLQAGLGALEPLDDIARQRLHCAFQTKLRAMILHCLGMLDHGASDSSPALIHIRALISQYEESSQSDVSVARCGKQWQLLKSALGLEAASASIHVASRIQKIADEEFGFQRSRSPNVTPLPTFNASRQCVELGGKSLGSRRLCPHGKPMHDCTVCRACTHGRLTRFCRVCNGCPHGKLKTQCGTCNGCPHGKSKSGCSTCYGCPHGRLRRNCTKCVGACDHGKLKRDCTKCNGCTHGALKRHCRKCNACPHG
mmetsp:Transcript_125392/g.400927  ORF Transcript_125392/g.400927 Transcript_125392/m.400927 type:complete len:552 (+) Transcript_125392:2-1657(+)